MARHRKVENTWQESLPSLNWRKYGYHPGRHQETPGTPQEEAEILRERSDAITIDETPQVYFPTKTINPADPRTSQAEYYPIAQTLVMHWGDGGRPYNYYNVTPQEWQALRRAPSPGKYINKVLNYHPYGRA